MKRFCSKYLQLLLVFTLLFGNATFAQAPEIQTTVDSNEILIGQQLHVKVAVNFPAGKFRVNWLSVPDSAQHFDVVEKGKADSSFTDNQLTGITQTITLTSFDSGKWNLPIFKVSFVPIITGSGLSLYSDSLPVTVSFSTADTTTQLKDIKPVYDVTVPYPWWYWAAGAAAILLLAGLIYFGRRYFKNKKVKQPVVSKLSAYLTAIKALEELESVDLTDPVQVKIYHTKSVDIFKVYLSASSGVNQASKSTGDLLMLLFEYHLHKDEIAKAATSLRCSDAVKFAKYIPETADSRQNMHTIKEMIEILHKNTPVVIPPGNKK